MIGKIRSAVGIIRAIENWPLALVDHAGFLRQSYVCRLRNGLRFRVRAGTDDSRSLFEIHLRNRYRAAVIPSGATVIDIGANIGCYSILAAQNAARVFACEPYPVNVAILRENVELNGATGVEVIPYAISAQAGKASLVIPDDDSLVGHSSLHLGRGRRTLEITCVTLEQIVRDADLAEIDLVKIGCQGSEYEILYGTSAEILSRVWQIIVECERFPDHPRWSQRELENFLRGLGFGVVGEGNVLYASRLSTHR